MALKTEINIKRLQTSSFNSLHDLRLIDAAPQIYEFTPNRLKFLKPATLTISFKNAISANGPFILHGSHNKRYQKTVWELVEARNAEKLANVKIYGFSFYTYIMARCGLLARILSHINNSFMCCAYVLYRKSASMEESIDISVVIVSEFVYEEKKKKKEELEQLNCHIRQGYVKGGEGMSLKPVDTERSLEMCLVFTEGKSTSDPFTIGLRQLDTVGFVVHHKVVAIENPVSGLVEIYETNSDVDENSLLWKLYLRRQNEGEIYSSE